MKVKDYQVHFSDMEKAKLRLHHWRKTVKIRQVSIKDIVSNA